MRFPSHYSDQATTRHTARHQPHPVLARSSAHWRWPLPLVSVRESLTYTHGHSTPPLRVGHRHPIGPIAEFQIRLTNPGPLLSMHVRPPYLVSWVGRRGESDRPPPFHALLLGTDNLEPAGFDLAGPQARAAVRRSVAGWSHWTSGCVDAWMMESVDLDEVRGASIWGPYSLLRPSGMYPTRHYFEVLRNSRSLF